MLNDGSTPVQPRNPLHGITLERMVTKLLLHYGWVDLGGRLFTTLP